MSDIARRWLRDVALICVGGLAAIAVLAPQVRAANDRADVLRSHETTIAARCTFRPDGSATCPAGVFHVDRVAK